MNLKHAACLAAVAAAFAAPAFADTPAVVAGSGSVVTSGTGVVVTPGTMPMVVAETRPMPGAVVAPIGTQVVTSPDGTTRTTITHYWANVPADWSHNMAFRRWQRLQ